MFQGDAEREAEKVPPYRPRRNLAVPEPSPGDDGEESTPQPGDGEGGSVDPEPGPGPRPKRPRKFTPKPGRSVQGRCSIRAIADQSGHIDRLQVLWSRPAGAKQSIKNLVVRVRIPSGSDETCVHPIGPRWFRIKELRHNGRAFKPLEGGFEVALPQGHAPFTILLSESISDANAVEVDVVGRRPANPQRRAAVTHISLPLLLEDGSRLDWPDARYQPKVRVAGNRATIIQALAAAPALERGIVEGAAKWAVEIRCPKTLLSRVELSSEPKHTVRWRRDELDGVAWIVPGLLAVQEMQLAAEELKSALERGKPARAPGLVAGSRDEAEGRYASPISSSICQGRETRQRKNGDTVRAGEWPTPLRSPFGARYLGRYRIK